MPLERKQVVIPFVRGVDQGGADPKNTTGLLLAENCTVSRKGVIEKRNGKTPISTAQSDNFLGSHKERPVLYGDNVAKLDNATPTSGDWDQMNMDALGTIVPFKQAEVDSDVVETIGDVYAYSGDKQVTRPEVAELGTIRIVAFVRENSSYCYTYDKHSGARISYKSVAHLGGNHNVRVVVCDAGTHAYFFYLDTNDNLFVAPIDATGAFETPIDLVTTHSWPVKDRDVPFDACAVDTQTVVVVYKESGADDMVLGDIVFTGATVDTANNVQAAKADIQYVTCCKWTTDEALVAHYTDGATRTVKVAVYDPSTGNTPTVSEQTAASFATDTVGQVAVACVDDDITGWVFWTEHDGTVPGYDNLLKRIRYYETTPASGTGAIGAEGEQIVTGACQLWCKPVYVDSRLLVGVLSAHYFGTTVLSRQRAYIVYECNITATPLAWRALPLAKWLVGTADHPDTKASGQRYDRAHVCTPQLLSTTSFHVAGLELSSQNYNDELKGNFSIHDVQVELDVTAPSDFEISNHMVIPGGAPAVFDGQRILDHCLLEVPVVPIVQLVADGSETFGDGGDYPDEGTHAYAYLFETTDSNGDVWRSPLSDIAAIDVTTGNRVNVTVRPLFHGRHLKNTNGVFDNVQIVFYRSDVPNSKYLRRLHVLDNSIADGRITWAGDTGIPNGSNEQEYTHYGTLHENYQPPSYEIACEWNNRIFLVDKRWRDRLIRYSLETVPGYGHGFPTNFYIRVPQAYGEITALAVLEDKLVIFKEDAILITTGRGLDSKGYGPGFAEPVFVNQGLGCIDRKSLVQTPVGLMFETHEGIYSLDMGLSLSPVGRAVKRITDEDSVTRAVLDARAGRVVFFTDGADSVLVYHYLFDAWTTWIGHDGDDAVVVDGTVYFKEAGSSQVLFHDSSLWLDEGGTWIPMRLRTAVMPLTGLFDAKRVWDMFLAGYVRSHCTITIKIAYDGDAVWTDTLTFDTSDMTPFDWSTFFDTFGSAADYDDQAMSLRWRGSRTNVESSIQLEISDAE